MIENQEEKPVREYELKLGKYTAKVRIMNEMSKEAIAEFNKDIHKIARKYLSYKENTNG